MSDLSGYQDISTDIWGGAYQAQPRMYEKQDGSIMGAFALTEGTKTILQKNPAEIYKVDGKTIDEWNLVLVSTTQDSIIATLGYQEAIAKLKPFVLDEEDELILVKEMSLNDMKELACSR